jgi:hypothetical protein
MTANLPSNDLGQGDIGVLERFTDVPRYEPEQILPLVVPEQEMTITATQRIDRVGEKARSLLEKIARVEGMIDERCARFKVTGDGGKGSRLFQAMVRVFNERTTTVTYSHYARAVGMRQQLLQQKAAEIRKT